MPDSYELHLRQIKRAKMEEQKTKPSDQSVVRRPVENNHGRKAKRIWWNGANGDASIMSSDSVSLVFDATDHVSWVVQSVNGNETARHNTNFIASIEWE